MSDENTDKVNGTNLVEMKAADEWPNRTDRAQVIDTIEQVDLANSESTARNRRSNAKGQVIAVRGGSALPYLIRHDDDNQLAPYARHELKQIETPKVEASRYGIVTVGLPFPKPGDDGFEVDLPAPLTYVKAYPVPIKGSLGEMIGINLVLVFMGSPDAPKMKKKFLLTRENQYVHVKVGDVAPELVDAFASVFTGEAIALWWMNPDIQIPDVPTLMVNDWSFNDSVEAATAEAKAVAEATPAS